MRTSFRLHMQTLYRLVILQAKCTIPIQALCLLYLSHPPDTGNGGKRTFDKGSDEEEKNVLWYLAFRVKATTITPTNATLFGWTKSSFPVAVSNFRGFF